VPEKASEAGAGGLVERAVDCPACRGRGQFPAIVCAVCAFAARMQGRQVTAYLACEMEGRTRFPDCGHVYAPALGATFAACGLPCARCDGAGLIVERRTAAAWASRDRRVARQIKRDRSEVALVLSQSGRAMGYSRDRLRALLTLLAPVCGATCRQTEKPCRRRVVLGRLRCRLHGGKSTGPKTEAGRARIGESNRRRSPGHSPTISPIAML